jgi:CheY-like chemotaxis protein
MNAHDMTAAEAARFGEGQPLPTVLVVDDEVRSQDALRRTLDEDFLVLTAGSADEARATIERHAALGAARSRRAACRAASAASSST